MKKTTLIAAGLLSLLPASLLADNDRPKMGACQGIQNEYVKVEFFNDSGQGEALVDGILTDATKSKVIRIDKYAGTWRVNIKTPAVVDRMVGGLSSAEVVIYLYRDQPIVQAVVYEVDGRNEFVRDVVPPMDVNCIVR